MEAMTNDRVQLATEAQTSISPHLATTDTALQSSSTDIPRGTLVKYKPGFQWVKFRLRYRQVAEASPFITHVAQAYMTYRSLKLQAQRKVA